MTHDLTSLKDDMTAFIEGHGMRRFRGYISDEIPSVTWDAASNPDGWKDFVELAKSAGSNFLTMSDMVLEKEELDFLIERLRNGLNPSEEDLEEARLLRAYTGKTGYVQLGWPYQGVMFVFEASTEWYENYQRLMEIAEEMGGIMIDDSGDEPF